MLTGGPGSHFSSGPYEKRPDDVKQAEDPRTSNVDSPRSLSDLMRPTPIFSEKEQKQPNMDVL